MTKCLSTYDPTTYYQAKGKTHWEQAMTTECDSLMKNKTWSLVPLPPRKKFVGCKWVYKTKFTTDRKIEKYKSILVAKGFNQLEGIDYKNFCSYC